jgi:hypothetical protein
MNSPSLRSYMELLIHTCHRRSVHAMSKFSRAAELFLCLTRGGFQGFLIPAVDSNFV